MSAQEESPFSGLFINQNGSHSLKSVPITQRQAWLRMTKDGTTRDYVVEVNNGEGYYGRGQVLTGKGILLEEVGDRQYHFQLQKSNPMPYTLYRLDENSTLVPGEWGAVNENLRIKTWPIAAYDHVLTETINSGPEVQGVERYIGVLSSKGTGWSPDGALSATKINHGTMLLETPHGVFYYEQPGAFEQRGGKFMYPQGDGY